jgi:hypothetical protein
MWLPASLAPGAPATGLRSAAAVAGAEVAPEGPAASRRRLARDMIGSIGNGPVTAAGGPAAPG